MYVEIKERGTKGQKSWLFWNLSRTVQSPNKNMAMQEGFEPPTPHV
jgi:hypothetical protein